MDINKINICQIREFSLSCWGCCGRDFKSKKEIEKDIKSNTTEFRKIKIPSTINLLKFRDRLSDNPDDLMSSGICSNLVDFGNGILACPLHLKINKLIPKDNFLAIHKKDLRFNHCDVNYECKLFTLWKTLSIEKKTAYIEWLEKQNFNNYTYSIANVTDKNLKFFK